MEKTFLTSILYASIFYTQDSSACNSQEFMLLFRYLKQFCFKIIF